jgi:hypothetical protein
LCAETSIFFDWRFVTFSCTSNILLRKLSAIHGKIVVCILYK